MRKNNKVSEEGEQSFSFLFVLKEVDEDKKYRCNGGIMLLKRGNVFIGGYLLIFLFTPSDISGMLKM